jgi:hypothetical protein
MTEKIKSKLIEKAVADGDWKTVYELEHGIERGELKIWIKGFSFGFATAILGLTIGGVTVELLRKKI